LFYVEALMLWVGKLLLPVGIAQLFRLNNVDRSHGVVHRLTLKVSVRAVNELLLSQKDSGFGGLQLLRQLLRVSFEKCRFNLTLPGGEL
jgi:hypothetical protein